MGYSRLTALLLSVHVQRINSVDGAEDEDEDVAVQEAQMLQVQAQCCQIMTRSVVCCHDSPHFKASTMR